MTKATLKKAQCLSDEIHSAECSLRDIKYYEQKLFDYNIKISLPRTVGTFATDSDLYFSDTQLKKDLLNTIKTFLEKKIQEAEKELAQL